MKKLLVIILSLLFSVFICSCSDDLLNEQPSGQNGSGEGVYGVIDDNLDDQGTTNDEEGENSGDNTGNQEDSGTENNDDSPWGIGRVPLQ